MNIRKAKIEDYDQIIKLYEELYNAEKNFDVNLSKTYNIPNKQEAKIKKTESSQGNKYF